MQTKVGTDAPQSSGQVLSILRFSDVIKKTGLSRGAIYQRMSNSEFPASIHLGGRAVGFIEHEVNGWLEQLVHASRSAATANHSMTTRNQEQSA